MPASEPFRPEHLASHGEALRRLARSLLDDGAEAEDVVQQTYVTALALIPLGLWFAVVIILYSDADYAKVTAVLAHPAVTIGALSGTFVAAGDNAVSLDFAGSGSLNYQLSRRVYRPVLPVAVEAFFDDRANLH